MAEPTAVQLRLQTSDQGQLRLIGYADAPNTENVFFSGRYELGPMLAWLREHESAIRLEITPITQASGDTLGQPPMSNWTGQSRWAYDHQDREANPVATESDKIKFVRRLADQFRSVRGVFDEYAADFTADGLAIPDQLILADVANWVSTHIEDSGDAVAILNFLDGRYPQEHIDVKGLIAVGFVESLARSWEPHGPQVRAASGPYLRRLLDILESQGAIFAKDLE